MSDLIPMIFLLGLITIFLLSLAYIIIWLRSMWIGSKRDKLEMRKFQLEIEKLEKERGN